ncbi:MAG: hypothetical protein ON057_001457 [Glomeribacter sp. 1016415]|nr:hypothetical protein [Glomeribacter sp. 1016415]
MRHISKNPSPIYPQQSVSSAGDTPSSSGNMRRARSPSPLGSSPLAKRRRGEAEEAQKSNSGGFDRARFDEVDDRIDNLYEQYGITTDINSLTIDDSNSFFAEEFEATSPLYKQNGVLESDFFQSEMLCDSESQERLEERGENQSDSAEDALTDLPTAHTDDWLADEDCEMSSEGESEASHAALSVNDFQAVEENTSLKRKRGRPEVWTTKLRKIAEELIEANANADPKLNGRELYDKLKAKCVANKPELACPSSESFRINYLKQGRKSPARWTTELDVIAKEIIKANANTVPKLDKIKQHAQLEKWCNDQEPKLDCPRYEAFRRRFKKELSETHVKWTPESEKMACDVINKNPSLGYRDQYEILKRKWEEKYPSSRLPKSIAFFNFKNRMNKRTR